MTTNTRTMPCPDAQQAPRSTPPHRHQRQRPVFGSTSDAKGTTPVASKGQDLAVEKDSRAAETPHRPLRVLIVEDEVIIAMELEMMLEELDAEVVGIAMSALEAEQIAASARPDLITMDINLKGGRDGVDAACAIYKAYEIRSVFISAYGNAAQKEAAAAANPLGWVRKPVYQEDLADILTQFKDDRS